MSYTFVVVKKRLNEREYLRFWNVQ